DGDYSRLAYVFLRGKELEGKGFFYKADVIRGQPDKAGNPIKLHVELTQASGVDPKGVIILMTGYGESVVQYQQIVEQFASEGFAVVAFDYRGHGLSDSPKGIPGYMDSASALLDDARAVIKWSKQINQKNLRLFSFGFSQGALMQMALQNERVNKTTFDALSVVSPTVSLGRRYTDKPSDQDRPLLEIAPLDSRTAEWNVIRQNVLFESEQGQHFKQWLDRGFASPYYLRRPSIKVWKSLIAELTTFQVHSITVPVSAFIGTRDQIIGLPDVLDARLESIVSAGNTRFVRRYFEKRGHYLLLDKEGQSGEIVKYSLETFNDFLSEYQNWLNIGKELASRNLVDKDVFERRLRRHFRCKDLWCEIGQFVGGVLSGEVKPNSDSNLNALSFYLLGRLGVKNRVQILGKKDQVFDDAIIESDDGITESDDAVLEPENTVAAVDTQSQTAIVSSGVVTGSAGIASPLTPRVVPL
ncbi:MAG: alpha/beta hydrolase fold protein, partial [uncultured bacterium]